MLAHFPTQIVYICVASNEITNLLISTIFVSLEAALSVILDRHDMIQLVDCEIHDTVFLNHRHSG